MSIPRIPPIRRFFQLQIPQVFRPTVTSVLAKTVGRMNLEGPAVGLTAVAYLSLVQYPSDAWGQQRER